MPYVTVGWENTGDIWLHYEDHGTGTAVVLVHGYLADGRSWEKQEAALLAAGYRVVSYDRRGGGGSSRPAVGYDYDTLAADLHVLLEVLDVRDAVLVGCCSGTGEITRFLGTYGQRRVRGAVLLAPLPPFLLRSDGNPQGADRGVVDDFLVELALDRPAGRDQDIPGSLLQHRPARRQPRQRPGLAEQLPCRDPGVRGGVPGLCGRMAGRLPAMLPGSPSRS